MSKVEIFLYLLTAFIHAHPWVLVVVGIGAIWLVYALIASFLCAFSEMFNPSTPPPAKPAHTADAGYITVPGESETEKAAKSEKWQKVFASWRQTEVDYMAAMRGKVQAHLRSGNSDPDMDMSEMLEEVRLADMEEKLGQQLTRDEYNDARFRWFSHRFGGPEGETFDKYQSEFGTHEDRFDVKRDRFKSDRHHAEIVAKRRAAGLL